MKNVTAFSNFVVSEELSLLFKAFNANNMIEIDWVVIALGLVI